MSDRTLLSICLLYFKYYILSYTHASSRVLIIRKPIAFLMLKSFVIQRGN